MKRIRSLKVDSRDIGILREPYLVNFAVYLASSFGTVYSPENMLGTSNTVSARTSGYLYFLVYLLILSALWTRLSLYRVRMVNNNRRNQD